MNKILNLFKEFKKLEGQQSIKLIHKKLIH